MQALQTEDDLIEIVNRIIPFAVGASKRDCRLKPSDKSLKDGSFDSLDQLIILMYITEIFGIDEQSSKLIEPNISLSDLRQFLLSKATIREIDLNDIEGRLKSTTSSSQ